MATLKDIAEELDVSMSLVSKVLNNRLGTTTVKPEKRKLIKETALRLRYSKNASSIALLNGMHDCIGVFLNCAGIKSSGVVERFVSGMSACARKHNKRQSLSFFSTDEDFCELAKVANKGKMDGVLTGNIGRNFLLDSLLDIQNDGIPVVTMYNEPIHPEIVNVGINQSSVSRIATEHLLKQGCESIVYINNHVSNRYDGYKSAITKAGIDYDSSRVYNPPENLIGYVAFSSDMGRNAVEYFVQKGIDFDGIVCQSDAESIGVVNYLMELGKKVPDDVKVIGVDNSPFCKFMVVPLSSIDQKHEQQAYLAADTLFRIIDGEKISSTLIEPELVVRKST